jgi:hypothetical protein
VTRRTSWEGIAVVEDDDSCDHQMIPTIMQSHPRIGQETLDCKHLATTVNRGRLTGLSCLFQQPSIEFETIRNHTLLQNSLRVVLIPSHFNSEHFLIPDCHLDLSTCHHSRSLLQASRSTSSRSPIVSIQIRSLPIFSSMFFALSLIYALPLKMSSKST